MKEKTYLLALLFLLVAGNVLAQNKTVSGTVSASASEPLIGVSVSIEGTSTGTITDIDGKYSLEITKPNAVLIFSYVGFSSQKVSVGNQSEINVVLKEDLQNLDEVVVVGYGVVKKRDLTGSVSSVNSQKLTERAVMSTGQALQGQAPGVVVSSSNARPGTDATVRIRGNRSLLSTNDPLYVVDGIPIVTGLSEISPSDIESIEILKDASATAIYGSRGANGVVIITTKKGKEGKASIDYNGYYGIQEAARTIPVFDGAGYMELLREGWRAQRDYPLVPTLAQDKRIAYLTGAQDVVQKVENSYDAQGVWHPELVKSNDWTKAALQTAPITNHELSIRGGTDKIKLLISGTYFNQDGVVKGQGYERFSVRINFDWNLNKYITVGAQTQYSHITQYYGPNIYSDMVSNNPLADIYNEDGSYTTARPGADAQRWNNLLNLQHMKRLRVKDRFLGSYYAEINLPAGLKFRSNIGIDYGPYSAPEFHGSLSSTFAGANNARAIQLIENRMMYTWENLLFWNKVINKDHSIGATFLQSIQEETFESYRMEAQNMPIESQQWYNFASGTMTSMESGFRRWNLASFMARVNYGYKDKYLLTASARYDGSSRLAEGNKWDLFPSLSLAWRIKEESFLKEVDVLSNLKIRAGWGLTGSSAIDPYQTQATISSSWNPDETSSTIQNRRYIFGLNPALTYYPTTMPNAALGWEKTSQFNAGVDFGFFNGRLGGSIDIYTQKTSNLLMNRQLPIVSGFKSVVDNIGSVGNKGLEIALNSVNIETKDFSWTTDVNFATNKEQILELSTGKNDDVGNKWFIGQPVSVIYDYKFEGIWQLGEEAEMAKYGSGVFKPGYIKVKDVNDDHKITGDKDRVIIGHTMPDWTASMANYFKYKNIDLNFFLNAVYGNTKILNRGMSFNSRYNSAVVNYWRVTAVDEAGNPTASNGSNEAPQPNKGFENPPFRDALNYYDGSYLRISQITLGYSFPKNICKKITAERLRIYATVQNPYIFTKFPGTDPETGESFQEPMPRTYTVGVNVSF